MKYHVIVVDPVKNTVKTETYSDMMAAYTAKCRIEEFADFGGRKVSVDVVKSA